MCAGFSSLALSLVIGKRVESKDKPLSHNNTYAALGIILLWFGWFGFNGGSAFEASYQAVLAVVSTNISAATAALSWAFFDYLYTGKLSLLSFIYGGGAGLIAMTPGSGYCPPWASLIIGFVSGLVSCTFSRYRDKCTWHDDAADVFSAHGISGVWGVFATGLWASANDDGVGIDGAFYGRGVQLGYQIAGIVTVGPYCFALSFIIAYAMKWAGFLRVTESEEKAGLDLAAEEPAYVIVPVGVTEETKKEAAKTSGDATGKAALSPTAHNDAVPNNL